jgi:hypothetical protein
MLQGIMIHPYLIPNELPALIDMNRMNLNNRRFPEPRSSMQKTLSIVTRHISTPNLHSCSLPLVTFAMLYRLCFTAFLFFGFCTVK